jgi:hypothetical protein
VTDPATNFRWNGSPVRGLQLKLQSLGLLPLRFHWQASLQQDRAIFLRCSFRVPYVLLVACCKQEPVPKGQSQLPAPQTICF